MMKRFEFDTKKKIKVLCIISKAKQDKSFFVSEN